MVDGQGGGGGSCSYRSKAPWLGVEEGEQAGLNMQQGLRRAGFVLHRCMQLVKSSH